MFNLFKRRPKQTRRKTTRRDTRRRIFFERLQSREMMAADFDIVTNHVAPGDINGSDEVVVGDFNRDGYADLFFREVESGANRILLFGENQTYKVVDNRVPQGAINGFDEVHVGDFDHDRRDDLWFRNVESGDNRIFFAHSEGNDLDNFDAVTNLVPRGWINGFDEIKVGDFNRDGYDDLFFREIRTGDNRIVLFGDCRQLKEVTNRIPRGAINGFDEFVIGDFDNDRRDDLLFRNVGSGVNRIFYPHSEDGGDLDAFDYETNRIHEGWINGADEVIVGNFDGIGGDDLFFRNVIDGNNRIISFEGKDHPVEVTNIVAQGDINGFDEFVAGGFTKDGTVDVMFRNIESGVNRFAFSPKVLEFPDQCFGFTGMRHCQGTVEEPPASGGGGVIEDESAAIDMVVVGFGAIDSTGSNKPWWVTNTSDRTIRITVRATGSYVRLGQLTKYDEKFTYELKPGETKDLGWWRIEITFGKYSADYV